MNGRVVKFKDISSVLIEALPLPSKIYPGSDLTDLDANLSSSIKYNVSIFHIQAYGEKLKFTLKTNEDEILLESSYDINAAKYWLKVLQDIVEFMQIPIPPKSSSAQYNASSGSMAGISPNDKSVGYVSPLPNGSNAANSPVNISVTPVRLTNEFSANSSVVFSSSTDILYILHHLCNSFESQYPILLEVRDMLIDIWKLLSDVRFNREAITQFGERLEGIVRLLGDENGSGNGGLLYIAGKNFSRLITASLTRFKTKLHEIEVYLVPLTSSGWLVHTLLKLSSASQSMKAKLQYYDNDVTSTFNQLYKSIMKSVTTSTQNNNSRANSKDNLVLGMVSYDMVRSS